MDLYKRLMPQHFVSNKQSPHNQCMSHHKRGRSGGKRRKEGSGHYLTSHTKSKKKKKCQYCSDHCVVTNHFRHIPLSYSFASLPHHNFICVFNRFVLIMLLHHLQCEIYCLSVPTVFTSTLYDEQKKLKVMCCDLLVTHLNMSKQTNTCKCIKVCA